MKLTMVLKFRIGGNLRFLSHQETMTMFEYALVRAQFPVLYSQGYNPRVKISLPLPRSVGVESKDELLCVSMKDSCDISSDLLLTNLTSQLPCGCELTGIEIIQGKGSYRALSTDYKICVSESTDRRKLNRNIENLCRSIELQEPLEVKRMKSDGEGCKIINLSEYIKSCEYRDNSIKLKCIITSKGTVRVDEILKLLGLDYSELSGPVIRENVEWKNN